MLTLEEVEEAMLDLSNPGYCLNCEEITHDSCEPDARKYKCPCCGENEVYGLEECLMMGIVE